MLGPYTAKKDRRISYKGNKIFDKIDDVSKIKYPVKELENRVKQLKEDSMWKHIANINHRINMSTNEYFDELGALFTTLPLTTRMISSPGAVYGKEAINYTTDTSPITLKWFNLKRTAFLSESSQIYLELALMQENVNHVYSIYNSFRKEKADATHLSEFHHIEYEGKVNQNENEKVALGLVERIIIDLLGKNHKDLEFFLSNKKMIELESLAFNIKDIPKINYMDVLDLLYKETNDDRYRKFTMQDNFGSWEEIKLTEIVGDMVAIKEFPILEIPFYHAMVDGKEPMVADNTDIIWPCYRETIGSGHRVRSKEELKEKAETFQLPKSDYEPYMQTRKMPNYEETSGFGLGWERMLQGLLEMPFIWSVSQFPRVDGTLKP
ncbi:asparagine--tRNA ligase [archaeon]|nr:asparagine--tRNA ligase [archaeon]|tara:strand:+ start:91 stop:1230 length:1140 start_codon:yes stop_codon:yes gene_type:complete